MVTFFWDPIQKGTPSITCNDAIVLPPMGHSRVEQMLAGSSPCLLKFFERSTFLLPHETCRLRLLLIITTSLSGL